MPHVGEMYVSARSAREYRAMFGLTGAELAGGPILDCPGGAAGFAASAAAVAVDPAYAMARAALLHRNAADTERAIAYTVEHPECYAWQFFDGPDALAAERRSTRDAFANNFPTVGRYVAAALPHLPFADDAFSLALMSHLLFVFADRLDRRFHLATLAELVRVTRGEVRVFPLIDPQTIRYPELDELRRELDGIGITSEIRRVGYVVQPGGGELFVCRAS